MTFAKPVFLYALGLLPLLLFVMFWANRSRKSALARLGDPLLIERLITALSRSSRHWKAGLWICGLTLLLLALARPQWGSLVQPVEQNGVQIMVALDVSVSMLAQDILPDRLSRAKLELDELITRLDGSDIGLVLFSGASFIQLPLTRDYATARSFLDAASPTAISRPGTAAGAALRTAVGAFDPVRTTRKVIVLVSDGESHDDEALPAAQQAASEGIPVYTIGLGTADGALIPEYNTNGEVIGYKRERSGEIVISRLNETLLMQIAEETGGAYYRIGGGADAVSSLISEIERQQGPAFQAQIETLPVERFQIFLLPAFVLLITAELLPERRPFRRKQPGGAA